MQNKLYIPVVEVECVNVVEVLAVAEVVVEAAEDDQVPLQQNHPVARPGRGPSRCGTAPAGGMSLWESCTSFLMIALLC